MAAIVISRRLKVCRLVSLVFPALLGWCGAAATASGQNRRAGVSAGEASLQARRYSEAMDRFEATLDQSPKDAAARRGEVTAATEWAATEVQQQHPDVAMGILERAIRRLPDEPALLRSFGLEATALGQFPIADQALHAAEKLKPGDPETVYALARLEIEEQHLPDAERDLKAYLAARPGDASAYFGLGHVYAMEQKNNEARQAFETSIKLQPRQTESFYQIGQIDLNVQDDAGAEAAFAKVLARDPRHAGALTGMGQLALRQKRFAEAEQYLSKAEASDPGYAPSHYYRGLALARLGRKEEAAEELKRGDSRPKAAAATDAASP
jgi:tetratricopeptide (TPR) repeat protein